MSLHGRLVSTKSGPISLVERLREIDDYLDTSTINAERAMYRRQKLSSAQVVYSYLESKTREMEDAKDEQVKSTLSGCIHIWNGAARCFHFFFPDEVSHDLPVVGKYWGAVLHTIEVGRTLFFFFFRVVTSADRHASSWPSLPSRKTRTSPATGPDVEVARLRVPCEMSSTLWTNGSTSCQLSCSTTAPYWTLFPTRRTASDRSPDDLVYLWMHVLMGLISAPDDSGCWQEHFERCEVLLRSGTAQLISELATVDLLEHTTVRPQELASLICLDLLFGRY